LKDKTMTFRCDSQEQNLIKALPFLLEEFMPGVSFNRSSALCYAANKLFLSISDSIYSDSDSLKETYKNVDEFRESLLQQAEQKK
jgi:hypothetical protein